MTNNYENHENDDFNEHEIGLPDEQAKNPGVVGNLAEAWRTKPLFKFMVLIIAVFAVGVAAFSFLGGNNANNDVARLNRPPNIKEAPGGAVSPYMREQTELANKERSEQAVATGGSALPTPIGQTTDVGGFGAAEKKDDPLTELRVETEQLKKQVQQQQVQQAQQQAQQKQQAPQQFDNSLAEAMQQQMRQLMEGWTPKGMKDVSVLKPEEVKQMDNASAANAAGASLQSAPPQPKALVNAGTVSYAQLLTEANSDVPGPILAQIVSGPLAGSRAVGSFEVSTGYEKYLVMRFRIADKKGTDYRIDAYALDPDTTLGGMATEVDERYFIRVVLPAAAGFLQGLGQGLAQGNSSITSNGSTSISTYGGNGFHEGIYNGLGDAAQTAGQFFQQQANVTKPLVRVASGTPIGMFFVAPVYDPNDPALLQQQQTNGTPAGAGAIPVNTGYGNGANGYQGGIGNGYGSQQNMNIPYPNYAQPNAGYRNPSTAYSPFGTSGTPFSPYTQSTPNYGTPNYGQ